MSSMLSLLLLLAQDVAVRAVPRDAAWLKRHEALVEEAKRGDADLLLLGDTLMDAWRGQKALWAERFAPLRTSNFGMMGDRAEHLLWRLHNGALDGRPKAAVLLIGTNNLGAGQSVERTAAAVEAVVDVLRPRARVLLLGIFPRGEKPDDPLRTKVREVNERLSKVSGVRYLDLGPLFLETDGTLSRELMPDLLHLSDKGYRVWADALREPLAELLK
jgi:lysophospholipase L1-like esterase